MKHQLTHAPCFSQFLQEIEGTLRRWSEKIRYRNYLVGGFLHLP